MVVAGSEVRSKRQKNAPGMSSCPQMDLTPQVPAYTYSPIPTRTQGVKNETAPETETELPMAIY